MTDQPDLPATLPAYAARAQQVMDPKTRAYFLAGAGAQLTYGRNLSDFEGITVLPRVLADLRDGGTGGQLLGQRFETPIFVAPMAYQTLLHRDGETGVAAAATAQGCGMVLSAQSSQPMEEVRAQGPGCDWMQMYWQPTRAANLAFAQRAADHGFRALVLTVDAPVQGVRDTEIEAGFGLPDTVQAVNLQDMVPPRFAPLQPGESVIFDRISHVLPRWDDVAWLCAHTPLPVVLKGILHPQDAQNAVQSGAAGVIVSNHGGRVLDGAPSAIRALVPVVAACAGQVPVLMDSGIRRGIDVFRALALGADAVLVGRPVCHGLAVAGAQGASHVLRLLRDELEIAMALTGCARLSDITRDRVSVPGDWP